MLSIAEYQKYANLQMAAEAFLYDEATGNVKTGDDYITALKTGNHHASRFPDTEAIKFADPAKGWTVLDQCPDTKTGFSGTLFKNNETGELVISFRSTEFIDDAARDNEATNKLEIGDFGWAFGQLADMETWYQELQSDSGPLKGKSFSVTGYSLGGHLATAFNLMHPGAAQQVVTFNGAGVGKIGNGWLPETQFALPAMVKRFQELRAEGESALGLAGYFHTAAGKILYQALKSVLAANGGVPTDNTLNLAVDKMALALCPDSKSNAFLKDLDLLSDALSIALKVAKEAIRAPALSSGPDKNGMSNKPLLVEDAEILAESLDYQLAVRLTAKEFNTSALSTVYGAENALQGKSMGSGWPLTNQYDLVGTETTTTPTGMVANSQYHYGNDASVFIEDQPLWRGTAPSKMAIASFANSGFKLLVDGYNQNDFGDTHSLVLIIDSLAIYNVLQSLDPEATKDTLVDILKAASATKAKSGMGFTGFAGSQGQAEGDVLENVLNGLCQMILGSSAPEKLVGKMEGNTWADIDDRNAFYNDLQKLIGEQKLSEDQTSTGKVSPFNNLKGKVTIAVADASLGTAARTDFAALLALLTFSPVVLKATAGNETAVEEALQTFWGDEYSAWQADQLLTPAQRQRGEGTYTDMFLADRAAMLGWVAKARTENTEFEPKKLYASGQLDGSAWTFEDRDSETNIFVTPSGLGSLNPDLRTVVFGSQLGDTLTGTASVDHLYGGLGGDILSGGKGSDYLEGNAGDDFISGDEGRDTLLGGSGIDTLIGGEDRDALHGGPGSNELRGGNGFDTYFIEGDDVIIDQDRQGEIKDGSGRLIAGAIEAWPDGKYGYVADSSVNVTRVGSNLVLTLANGNSVVLPDFQNGDLGLSIIQKQNEPETTRTIKGDLAYVDIDTDPSLSGMQYPQDDLGNFLRTDVPEVKDDFLRGSSGPDLIQTGAGDDLVVTSEGDDHIQLGAGRDRAEGRWWLEGNYIIEGGPDRDILEGALGDDCIYGEAEIDPALAIQNGEMGYGSGQKEDWLTGFDGKDILVGSTGNDLLDGGDDDDVMVAGQGDDNILGDASIFVVGAYWPSWEWSFHDEPPSPEYPFGSRVFQADGGLSLVQGDDTIYGGAGKDWIRGDVSKKGYAGGRDFVDGGSGDDDIVGEGQNDTLKGGSGNDTVFGDGPYLEVEFHGNDYIDGGDGNDQVWGEGGDDELYGGGGNDLLSGDSRRLDGSRHGSDQLDGGEGSDSLLGEGGEDTLYGGTGSDTLNGDDDNLTVLYHGNDDLHGGDGSDYMAGGGGDDTLSGDNDEDTLFGDGWVGEIAKYIDTSSATGSELQALLDGIAKSNGNDVLNGGAGNDYLDGQGGDDCLDGGTGDDRILGQDGDDWLLGGAGQDFLSGGNGRDQLQAGKGDDTVYGGDGDDSLSGEAGNDSILGEAGNDAIQGGGGADRIAGLLGMDYLEGEAGNDELQGGDADDTLLGGAGEDLLLGQEGNDSLDGQDASDEIQGGAGLDTLSGGAGNDRLYGQGDSDTLDGGDGNDDLQGGDSSDRLLGGAGDDALFGQNGADFLDGGGGDDALYGDGGSNTYAFGRGYGHDAIFNVGRDGTAIGQVKIEFNADVEVEDVRAYRDGDDLVLWIPDTGDSLVVANHFLAGASSALAEVRFARGTAWSSRDIPLEQNGDFIHVTTNGADTNDVFRGSEGPDNFVGAKGNDTFHWGYRSGKDVITDVRNGTDINTVVIDAPVVPADVTVLRVGNDCVLRLNGSPDELTIKGGLASESGIFQIKFESDGTLWTHASLFLSPSAQSDDLWGTSAAEMINGGEGSDTIDGGGGADSLYGGAGKDLITVRGTEVIADGGDGDDSFIDWGSGIATLVGGAGNDTYSSDNSSRSLVEDPDGGRDTVVTSLTRTLGANIENLLLTGSYAINGTGNGLDNLLTGNSAANQLLGGDGADTLDGAGGSDILMGETGNDTYLFGVGSGQDTISGETGGTGALDAIVLGAGVLPTQVSALQDGNDLVLVIAGTADQLRVVGFYSPGGTIEQLRFVDDPTIWDGAAIQTLALTSPNAGNNLLQGGAGNDSIAGFAGNDTLNGDGGDDTLDGGSGNDVLTGGFGNDCYLVDGTADAVVENADEGVDGVQSSVTYTLPANIENLTLIGTAAIDGTGNGLDNLLVGNGAVNRLTGGAGSDTLDGGAGGDILVGGDGGDAYLVDNAGDLVSEYGSGGTDTVITALSYSLSGTLVENLILTGSLNVSGTGNDLDNRLTGNVGNNALDGGQGADTLLGSAGDDTYVVDNAGDRVVENADEGIDSVQASVTYTLSPEVENLTLTGAAAINGTGNALANLLTGNSANNILTGGAGDDRYVITSGDTVVESANEGTDSVQADFTYTLGANVENLTLTGSVRINGTGNTLANVLIGNIANNVLTGGAGDDRLDGGGGSDALVGGTGNDYYVVDDSRDTVTENAGEGTDTIQVAFTYTLAANLENLVLASGFLINGTGHAGNNAITGNALDNVLNGAAGADTLVGGGGNDTFVVDNSGDLVVENGAEGSDTVQSSVSHTLAANVENLTLTGSTAINGSGNNLDNLLTGNTGANVLAGGAGNDTYVVGTGDTVVENASEGIDTVQSAVTFTLGANLENLTLTGSATANATGNGLDNILTGNSAANILTGGAGDDTYVIGTGDTVVENAGAGIDTVLSSVTHTLAANVENLTLTGSTAINGTGNALDNVISGNSAANVLTGGAGNDTYVVGSGDTVVESANQGTDAVQSAVTFTLGANLENLTLTSSAAINGTGNALDNVIVGNDADNVLDGGAGNDILKGGKGNDSYVLDSAGDLVVENPGEGSDTVQTWFSFASSGGIENVTLLGSGAIDATGDASNNVLTGNSAANRLTGGAGNDTLSGGGGADILVGGAGDDLYVVAPGAVMVENAGEGRDTVQSSGTVALADNFEDLILTGSAAANGTGNGLANVITGNAGNNVLDGGSGADTLYGGEGSDTIVGTTADMMRGGAGDDVYVLETGLPSGNTGTFGDQFESGGAGIDTILIDVSIMLNNQDYYDPATRSIHYAGDIENATLLGTGNLLAWGTDSNNVIIGNGGNNRLYSRAGDDRLEGGAGDDSLEGGNGADTLIGGTGNDTLKGDGVDALDSLVGGAGNDVYYLLNNAAIVENANEGIDSIYVQFGGISSYTLPANFENLYLSLASATGNTLDNYISGGPGTNTLYSLAGNDTLDGYTGADSLYGGIGNDVYVVDDVGDVLIENLNEGTDTAKSTVSFTLPTNVENLVLTGSLALNGTGNAGNNTLSGNAAYNTLNGGAGDDRLDGGSGVDTLVGGLGNDTYVYDSLDAIVESAGEGSDTLEVAVTYTLVISNLENLTLTGTDAINATGNGGANLLTGNTAANVLDGGTGADTLVGGKGDDTYQVDNSGDVVGESAGEGIDTVYASASYTLSANIEVLTLTGSAAINGTGNAGNNTLTGNSGANILSGGQGDDTYMITDAMDAVVENADEGTDTVQTILSYALGANVEKLILLGSGALVAAGNELNNLLQTSNINACTLKGGLGDDTYIPGWSPNIVIENPDEGIDTVQAYFDYTLPANVENLILTGTAAQATGNALDNALTGNGNSNTLSGGAGADTMAGGLGNDIYVVDQGTDVVVEKTSEGVDTVQASVTYSLGANLEHLTLTGTRAINGTGNALGNTLTGNSAANILAGSTGNDTYVVDGGDTIVEYASEGVDTVIASTNYVLGSELENLVLSGPAAIAGIGNLADNSLVGNDQNNLLQGEAGHDTLDGGYGADTLIGGSGNDTYVVNSASDLIQESAGEGSDTVCSPVTYLLGGNLENLTLTGVSAINGIGNDLDNVLTGNGGANVLTGGLGDDTYVVGSGDKVIEAVGQGGDTVLSSVTFALSAEVENLTLTGTAAIDGTGNELGNVLIGNGAKNILDGRAGIDTMRGGAGNDVYVVDVSSDQVVELYNEGLDTVQSLVNYLLPDQVENLDLSIGLALSGTGNGLDNSLVGNIADNVLTGLAGDDSLDGRTGADTLIGGGGNDTYQIDQIGDVVVERTGEGVDTVQSTVDCRLAQEVENLTLLGYGAVSATGNALDNLITGSGAGNYLDGGAGADTLRGGVGNDTYVVDNLFDVVQENNYEGNDRVLSSVAFTLGTGLEHLTLIGSHAINGTGNDLANTLQGNVAANILTGGSGDDRLDGGAGADTLIGGAGNDTYVVDDAGDVVEDMAAYQSVDQVLSSVSYVLGANLECLVLTGNAAINGTGNALDNTLFGNDEANVLDGGVGADVMAGGDGDDLYVVDSEADWIGEYAWSGMDSVRTGLTYTLGQNLENLVLTGSSAVSGTGNQLDNLVIGNGSGNVLDGADGNDVLQGGAGKDQLHGGDGNNLLDGGIGADSLRGGVGDEMFIGGAGNDVIVPGSGADLIAFNRGDGQELVAAGTEADDTLSLGGGIKLGALAFRKDGNNLVLEAGNGDAMSFQDWYAAPGKHSVLTLQLIEAAADDFNPLGDDGLRDNLVELFDFERLANRFDQERLANPGLTAWSLSQALMEFQLAGSDIAAIGGDLAYRYGTRGTLAGSEVMAVQGSLGAGGMGRNLQSIQPSVGLPAGAVTLI